MLDDDGKEAIRALEVLKDDPKSKPEAVANQQKLVDWWESVKALGGRRQAPCHGGKPLRWSDGPEANRRWCPPPWP